MILGCKGETRHLTGTWFQQGARYANSLKSLPSPNFPSTSHVKLSSPITPYSTQTACVQRRSLCLAGAEIARGRCWNHSLCRVPWQTGAGSPFQGAESFKRSEAEGAAPVCCIANWRRGCLEESTHVNLLCIILSNPGYRIYLVHKMFHFTVEKQELINQNVTSDSFLENLLSWFWHHI